MRKFRILAVILLASGPSAPGWAALVRVEALPSGPTVMAAPSAASLSPLSSAAAPLSANSPLAAVLSAIAPMLASGHAAQAPAAPQPLYSAPPSKAAPASRAEPLVRFAEASDGSRVAVLTLQAAAAPERAPEAAGRLFDAAPAAPNFDELTPVRAPQAPEAWKPRSAWLKPAAAAVNAWRDSRHRARLASPLPGERATSEEIALRRSLTGIHEAIVQGRLQDALQTVADHFQTKRAADWYRENLGYLRYRAQAFAYMRFVENAVKDAYERAAGRGWDETLAAEAAAASREGSVLGHAWRATAIQEKDSSHCAQNAFYNAIAASVGFARPTTVAEFVAASRAALNRPLRLGRGVTPESYAAFAAQLGLKLGGRDVGEGMGADAIGEWASVLGMKLAPRGPPQDAAAWSALLEPGREVLLSLRMFHRGFRLESALRAERGHDLEVLHHEVYLLGAFDSPSRGERLFMVQDSGSGTTMIATAAELTAMTQQVQVLETAGPVRIP